MPPLQKCVTYRKSPHSVNPAGASGTSMVALTRASDRDRRPQSDRCLQAPRKRVVAVGDNAIRHHAAQRNRGDDRVRAQVDDRERPIAVIGDQRPRAVRRNRHRARVFADRDFRDHPVKRRDQDRHRIVDHVGGGHRPPIPRQRNRIAGIGAVDARIRQREERQRRRGRVACLGCDGALRLAAGSSTHTAISSSRQPAQVAA